jgi:glycine cleavage system H protein
LTIGLTPSTAETLGSISALELPSEGDDFMKGDIVAEVRASQGNVELTTPAAGLVTSVNETVRGKPSLLLEDPGEEGWLVQIEIQDPSDLEEFG